MHKVIGSVIAGAALGAAGLGLGAGTASASITPCGSANGYTVSADPDTTSCGFALNVARAMPSNFSGQSTTVTASSPATGQSYSVNCFRKYQVVLNCNAGSGAFVVLGQ